METLIGGHWHHLSKNEVVELLDSDMQSGLDTFEVKHRQEHFGPNLLTPKRGKSPLARFLLQFNNPLVYILLASSLVTAIIKDVLDAVVIFGVVLVNAIIGYIQESRAEKAIEALAQAITTEATVVRAGKTQRLSAAELVPGDLVQIKSGDKIPADLRLLQARDLQVAEAALTGESLPVEKNAAERLSPEVVLAERRNMAYASTLVTYGQGMGIVIATGDNTEVGRISKLISAAKDLETPLTRKLAQFSRVLLYAILTLAAIATAIELWRGQPIIDTVTAAIALAVAMIPEGLPAALTITLAIGVSRMARRRAIIRKLPAVETLGSVSVICSDKTGTLTQNQMTVQQIAVGDLRYQVTGICYAPSGQITKPGEASHAATDPGLQIVLRAGLLCNDSQLVQEDGTWQAQGDPTEVALTVSAHKAGLRLEDLQVEYPRLDVIPFESQHQYMATLHSVGGGQERVVYIKGAAEVLLEKCSQALDESGASIPLDRNRLHQEVESMASQGLRVLAFAMKTLPAGQNALTNDMVAFDLTFLGVQAMIDPPRSEAVAAVQACQNAGIRVKMITGDHALTAAAIARQIGLNGTATDSEDMPTVITSKEMANLTDQELIEVADRIDVFARVSPEQKLRLVEALQARNQVVAMTGDGVNDGPALKQSNIGIAMGITGTEVAKEAADMVLTDDNFATIEAAVEEGRGVFDNLTKIISWTLPTNLGEGLIILLALLLGVALPILPIQILWINMISVAVLGTVLALESKELNIMRRPPRHPDAHILTRELLWRIVLVGGLILIGAFGLFEWELQSGNSLTQARTVAVNVVVLIGIAYLLNCRSLTQSMFRIGLFSNPWIWVGIAIMLVLQLAFTYLPFMNQLFSSAPITLGAWARVLGLTLAGYLLIEFEKWIRRQVQSARTDRKRQALIKWQSTV